MLTDCFKELRSCQAPVGMLAFFTGTLVLMSHSTQVYTDSKDIYGFNCQVCDVLPSIPKAWHVNPSSLQYCVLPIMPRVVLGDNTATSKCAVCMYAAVGPCLHAHNYGRGVLDSVVMVFFPPSELSCNDVFSLLIFFVNWSSYCLDDFQNYSCNALFLHTHPHSIIVSH